MNEYGSSMTLRYKIVCYQVVIEQGLVTDVIASHYDDATDTYDDYILTKRERTMVINNCKREFNIT